jgi:hypothetical protein
MATPLIERSAMRAFLASVVLLATLGGCSTVGGPYPSLQPRANEQVDPRLPVPRPLNDRPVKPALASRLAELVAQAHAGDAAFQPAAAEAERLAGSAGGAQSEGWIAAQEAVSAAIAAAGPTRIALGDIDEISSTALQTQGGIAPKDLAAIKSAGAEVAALDQRQSDRIKAIQRRLGL